MSDPFIAFRFKVSLYANGTAAGGDLPGGPLCSGEFSDAAGLEATMTPKTVREGGRNHGAIQLVGPTSFGTMTLKRGVTGASDLWTWFDLVTGHERFGLRLQGQIDVQDGSGAIQTSWKLLNVMPIKFKAPDLSGAASQVAIEEVQLVYEDLTRA